MATSGCATHEPRKPSVAGRYHLELPAIRLEEQEFIQAIILNLHGGRITSINRFLDDWDTEVTWDTPDAIEVALHARHFSSGLSDPQASLGEFITVEERHTGSLQVTVTLKTASTDPTGRRERELTLVNHQIVRIATTHAPRAARRHKQ